MTNALTALPLPQFTGVNAMRDALIVRERAKGTTIAATASKANCGTSTVERVQAEHRELIEAKRMEMAERFMVESGAIVDALVTTAKDSSNRLQVSAFKELSEKLCGWGLKNGDTHIHGDVNVGSIDARSITLGDFDPDKLEEKRRALGL